MAEAPPARWPPSEGSEASGLDQLAVLVAAAGLSGKVTVLMDSHGNQVTYNGHPLYAFADDHADQVTGQGVSDFFVATPGLATISTSSNPGTAPAVSSGGGY